MDPFSSFYGNLFPFQNIDSDELVNLLHSDNPCNSHITYQPNAFEKFLENSIGDNVTSTTINCKYYNESEFQSAMGSKNSSISAFHINIRSLPKNHVQLVAYIENLKFMFDFILLSEIGHSSVDFLSNIFDGYNFEYVLPPTRCGGVGIFYSNKYYIKRVRKQVIASNMNCSCSYCQVEDIWLDITHNNRSICISACYRHPKGSIGHFVKALEDTFDCNSLPHTCIIGGDFNINVLKTGNCAAINDFVNLMLCQSFTPSITLPTRFHDHSTFTLIDNIFLRLQSDLLSKSVHSGNLYTDISDHLPNFCIIEDGHY